MELSECAGAWIWSRDFLSWLSNDYHLFTWHTAVFFVWRGAPIYQRLTQGGNWDILTFILRYRWLTMVRLESLSYGESELSLQRWEHMQQMEATREERLRVCWAYCVPAPGLNNIRTRIGKHLEIYIPKPTNEGFCERTSVNVQYEYIQQWMQCHGGVMIVWALRDIFILDADDAVICADNRYSNDEACPPSPGAVMGNGLSFITLKTAHSPKYITHSSCHLANNITLLFNTTCPLACNVGIL